MENNDKHPQHFTSDQYQKLLTDHPSDEILKAHRVMLGIWVSRVLPECSDYGAATDALVRFLERKKLGDFQSLQEHVKLLKKLPLGSLKLVETDDLISETERQLQLPNSTSLIEKPDQVDLVNEKLMILLGESGSGKTVLASQLVQSSIDARASGGDHAPSISLLLRGATVFGKEDYTSSTPRPPGHNKAATEWVDARNQKTGEQVCDAIMSGLQLPGLAAFHSGALQNEVLYVILDEMGPFPQHLRSLCSKKARDSISSRLSGLNENKLKIFFIAAGTGCHFERDPVGSIPTEYTHFNASSRWDIALWKKRCPDELAIIEGDRTHRGLLARGLMKNPRSAVALLKIIAKYPDQLLITSICSASKVYRGLNAMQQLQDTGVSTVTTLAMSISMLKKRDNLSRTSGFCVDGQFYSEFDLIQKFGILTDRYSLDVPSQDEGAQDGSGGKTMSTPADPAKESDPAHQGLGSSSKSDGNDSSAAGGGGGGGTTGSNTRPRYEMSEAQVVMFLLHHGFKVDHPVTGEGFELTVADFLTLLFTSALSKKEHVETVLNRAFNRDPSSATGGQQTKFQRIKGVRVRYSTVKLSCALDPAKAKRELAEIMEAVKRGWLMIVVNGDMASFADLIVFIPGWPQWLSIQAKRYLTESLNEREVWEELSKMGVSNKWTNGICGKEHQALHACMISACTGKCCDAATGKNRSDVFTLLNDSGLENFKNTGKKVLAPRVVPENETADDKAAADAAHQEEARLIDAAWDKLMDAFESGKTMHAKRVAFASTINSSFSQALGKKAEQLPAFVIGAGESPSFAIPGGVDSHRVELGEEYTTLYPIRPSAIAAADEPVARSVSFVVPDIYFCDQPSSSKKPPVIPNQPAASSALSPSSPPTAKAAKVPAAAAPPKKSLVKKKAASSSASPKKRNRDGATSSDDDDDNSE